MVLSCSFCPRLISVSRIAGGNPVALSDPESWSLSRRGCYACGATLCDACAPEGLMICPKCHGAIDPPPRDPSQPYVYVKPLPHRTVKPGPGPADLMDIPTPIDRILAAIPGMIPEYGRVGDQSGASFLGFNIIYRMFGSPRAWQLGDEQALRRLDPASLQVVCDWAKAALADVDQDGIGEEPSRRPRYLYSPEPPVTYEGEFPKLDLSDTELVERYFWLSTMPIEFVERVARLQEDGL